MAQEKVQESQPIAGQQALPRVVFVNCCRLLAVATAIGGIILVIITTAGEADIWGSLLWNTLFLAVPTMLFVSFFGSMAAIAAAPHIPWHRVLRDFAVGLAGALAVPLGVVFVFFQNAITPTAGLYLLIGLGTNYVLWRELRGLQQGAPPIGAAIEEIERSEAAA